MNSEMVKEKRDREALEFTRIVRERSVVVLLCAGNKSSQKKHIKEAKLFWADYKRRA